MASSDYLTMTSAYLEYSLNCSDVTPTWVNFCAETASISVTGGDRNIAERTLFCDTSEVTVLGSKNAFNLTVDVLYSEAAGSPAWQALWTAYQTVADSCDFGIRWAPKGNTAGNKRYTACGVLLDFPPPSGDADGSEVIVSSLVMQAATVDQDTIP